MSNLNAELIELAFRGVTELSSTFDGAQEYRAMSDRLLTLQRRCNLRDVSHIAQIMKSPDGSDGFGLVIELAQRTTEHYPVPFDLLDFALVYHFALELGRPLPPEAADNSVLRALHFLLTTRVDDLELAKYDKCVLVRTAAALNPVGLKLRRGSDEDPFSCVPPVEGDGSRHGLPAYLCRCVDGKTSLDDSFQVEGLWVPESYGLTERIEMSSPFGWSTQDSPTNWQDFSFGKQLLEYMSGPVPEQFSVNHTGHGMNSYALTTRLALGQLSAVIQVGWGGAYSNGNDTQHWNSTMDSLNSVTELFYEQFSKLPSHEFDTPWQRKYALFYSDIRAVLQVKEFVEGRWVDLIETDDFAFACAALTARVQTGNTGGGLTSSVSSVATEDSDEVDLSCEDEGNFYDSEDIYIALESAGLVDVKGVPSHDMDPEAFERNMEFLEADAKKNGRSTFSDNDVPLYYLHIDIWDYESTDACAAAAFKKFGTDEDYIMAIAGPRWSVALRRGAKDGQIPLNIETRLLEAVDGSVTVWKKQIPQAEWYTKRFHVANEIEAALNKLGYAVMPLVPERNRGMHLVDQYILELAERGEFAEYTLRTSVSGEPVHIPIQVWIEDLLRDDIEMMIDAYFGNDGRDEGLAIGDGWCIRLLADSDGRCTFDNLIPLGKEIEARLTELSNR